MHEPVAQTCVSCGKTRPIHRFARYTKKRETRRRMCMDCGNQKRNRWLARLSTKELAAFNQRQAAHFKEHDTRVKRQRARMQAERKQNVEAIVQTLRARGMTIVEIAERSGVSRRTLGPIAQGRIGERAFLAAKTEDRLVALLVQSNEEIRHER